MKKLLSLLALTCATLSANAASEFEGQLTYQVDSEGQKQDISFLIKGNKMAVNSPANPQGTVLIDRDTMEAKVIIPQQKMYMDIPAQKFIKNANKTPTGTFDVTDETRKILNYTARKVIYTEGSKTTTLWITDELGSFQPLEGPLAGETPEVLLKAFPNGGMPLEITMTENGKPMTITVTSLKSEKVPDSKLEVPAGYRALNMGGLKLPGMPMPGMP
tara:strand:- start:21822 stop:22472 length:651 start_codon:yes stop_codon:yes gene_type:complete